MAKKIVITEGNGWYKDRVGEVFNVMERNLNGNLPEGDYYFVEHPKNNSCMTFFVSKENCVVLKEPTANLDTLDLIANLTRRVSDLEREVKRLKSKKRTRDDIVKQAIEDVAKLVSESSYDKYQVKDVIDGGLEPFDPDYDEVIFEVNRDKRTVVALIRYKEEKTVWARGIAKCAPNDVFNAHIGKAIALRRALGLEVPAEYLNAPQPKEPRVGDIVKWTNRFDESVSEIHRVNRIDGEEYWLGDGWDYLSSFTVLDDTESTERAAQEAAANDR